mmetsp:Transcript_2867/g.3197  ORF Transcript_2867/g.3197 Transcript_2867/m.3197 type:complete len:141 (+) Transcript_2867:58-480(+)
MFDFLDTAGQEEYSSMRAQWVQDHDCFVIGYSITSKTSFNDCKSDYFPCVLKVKDTDNFDKIPAVCIGNKCDLEDNREVSYEEGKALADEYGIPFFETSAKDRINIDEVMVCVTREYWKKMCQEEQKPKKKKKKKWSLKK